MSREIPHVEGNELRGAALNSRREDVSIIGIRKLKSAKVALVPRDQSVRDGKIHQIDGALQTTRIKLWPVQKEVARPLLVNFLRPARLENFGAG